MATLPADWQIQLQVLAAAAYAMLLGWRERRHALRRGARGG